MEADHSSASPVPAVGYIRVSTAREEMISPELQRAAIERKARADHALIADDHWIEELDESGRRFGRKGVQKAIDLVRKGVVRRVYVWKYSRFGRNATLVSAYVAEMEETGGQLISATEDIDAATAVGKFTRGMLWQIDDFHSNVIGEQWQEAHARRRRNGLPHNGGPRFGYLYHRPASERASCPQSCGPGECEAGYVPDPATGEHAEWMFAAYNGGLSVRTIAISLNERGLTTTGGKPWDQRMVRKYMDSGFAAGLLAIRKPGCDCTSRHCPHKMRVPGAHEPVIDEATWKEYLRQRDARASLPPRVEAPRYPLTGLVKCGRCEAPMTATGTRKGHAGYLYACSAYIRSGTCRGTWIARHRVESAVVAWLSSFGEDIDAHAEAEQRRLKVRDTAAADRRRLAAEAASVETDLGNLAIRLAREQIPFIAYRAATGKLLARREEISHALELVTAAQARSAQAPAPVAVGLAVEWPTLSPAGQRQLLSKLVDHIEVQGHGLGARGTLAIISTWNQVYFYGV